METGTQGSVYVFTCLRLLRLYLKQKHFVHHEDEALNFAVPPQFAVLGGALGDRQSSVFAVTGNPVLV